ncbi:MAG: TetR/AcrR family transcriptional regulator [Reyranellaceae bacterium]
MPTGLKPRKKPTQERSAVTVDAIVEAAIRILRRDGWAGLTTTRVAERAGVSVGSLYQYFPNRAAIAVEIVRRRTRQFLTAVLAADLGGAADFEAVARRAMAAFIEQKRAELAVSLALRDNLAALQGRQAIIEEARAFVPALQAKLAAAVGVAPEPARLAVALAAVEGAVWEILTQDDAALDRPETEAALARLFTSLAKPAGT